MLIILREQNGFCAQVLAEKFLNVRKSRGGTCYSAYKFKIVYDNQVLLILTCTCTYMMIK